MSLADTIVNTNKEIAGSRSKNRLTVQISYAIELIIDYYSTDYLILMDYIEDVSVICDPAHPSSIHLYQVKTKSSDKQYLLSTVINDKWFQKLYENAEKYRSNLGSASVVCNTDIVNMGREIFPNEKTALDDTTIQSNIKSVRTAIANDQGIDESAVDLSHFYFVRSTLSTKGHKEEAEYKFQNFLLKQEPDLQIATAKTIFSLLYDELDSKFNQEISEECTDITEIFNKKGLAGEDIKDMICCGLSIQLPSLDKLFAEYNITTISQKRILSSKYSIIKMDMFSNMPAFIQLKKTLMYFIESANQKGIDDLPTMLSEVYSQAESSQLIPEVYRDESYLKILIMTLAYKYCYGGVGN